jgi:hypothetical protein
MSDTLFTIVSKNNTQYRCTENFGELTELLHLLREVKMMYEAYASFFISQADRLLCSLRTLPTARHEPQRLFKTLEPEEYAKRLQRFQTNPSEDRYVVLDYDGNRSHFPNGQRPVWIPFPVRLWSNFRLRSALRKKDSGLTFLNEKAFVTVMERICKASTSPCLQNKPQYIKGYGPMHF